MKTFQKEIIFWYGLNKIIEKEMHVQYIVNMDKEFVLSLATVAFYGIQQYSLYRGISISEIPNDELGNYSEYILNNYNDLYKVRFGQLKDKPKKIILKSEEEMAKAKQLLEAAILPYFNEYCFKTLNGWRTVSRSYIASMLISSKLDINHKSDDGKIKTSEIYPFLFTLNLINNNDQKGLYQRISKYFDRKKILKSYESGRQLKPKEIEYLQDTMTLLHNDEEWQIFVSNFAIEKWKDFGMFERYKALFQLSKLTCILMKDEISSITMFGDGVDQFEMLEDYLPLFIYEDKIIHENDLIKNEVIEKYKKTLSPFSHIYINSKSLISYIESKDKYHVKVDSNKLSDFCYISSSVISKLKIMLLTHEYLPDVIDQQITSKKKIWVDILNIFASTERQDKYKRNHSFYNVNLEDLFITEEEFNDILSLENVKNPKYSAYPGLKKIGTVASYILGLNNPTAKVFDYDLKEFLKYLIVVFGPHPLGFTLHKKENIELIIDLFIKYCEWYQKQEASVKLNFSNILEMPLRLLEYKNK